MTLLAPETPAEADAERPSARLPLATYRLQLHRGFTFRDATRIVPYLHALGISDLYASPFLRASPGSTHGYDVTDHSELNPAIGSIDDLRALAAALRERGMGLLLDIVPNHMGIGEPGNRWWMDVLEHGPSSPYAGYFDINWSPRQPDLQGKVLLPILGNQYGSVLEQGELALRYEEGAFLLVYFDHRLPIAPETYALLLQPCLGALGRSLAANDERMVELQSILTGFERLPPRCQGSSEMIVERRAQTERLKQRLAALAARSTEVRDALDAALHVFNGAPGAPSSFDRLDALLERQAYRLAFWRVAAEEINYRRFFDINQLAAVRVEQPEVFEATHQLILRLLAEEIGTGLRIDHPDGLWDPGGYLRQLQRRFVEVWCAQRGSEAPAEPQAPNGPAALPLYIVVEKILSHGEQLPDDWPVHGTTGYDFLNAVGGLFVDGAHQRQFDDLYARFIGRRILYRDLVNSTKKMIMLVSLASEVDELAQRLDRLAARHRRFRDFTLNSLAFAIREVIAALPIYRTYCTCDGAVREPERQAIERAVAEAKRRNPRTAASIFDFLRDVLLLRFPIGEDAEERLAQCEFVMKFQQTTGPVMAKGVEDTAFYIYNRLVSLNEVGGEPDRFGVPVAVFHRHNAERAARWPHSLLATSTHDTKRSEDVRARISVLSEIPREWRAALGRWSRLNARHKRRVDGQPAPDRNDEYLLYQTLLGAWPFEPLVGEARERFVARIQAYMEKAIHEAKVHTSWVNPNAAYDQAVSDFVSRILDAQRGAAFLASFQPLWQKVAHFGMLNSLSQTLLKLTAPGVPDFYQGNEIWDFSLVDPDNRRPVDFERRAQLLEQLRAEIAGGEEHLPALLAGLLNAPRDGRIKLYVTHRALQLRQRCPAVFQRGSYEPLEARGAAGDHVCAFARACAEARIVVVAPRLLTRIVAGLGWPLGREVWRDTRLTLPDERDGQPYRDVFSGARLRVDIRDGTPGLDLADVFATFPVALLERIDE